MKYAAHFFLLGAIMLVIAIPLVLSDWYRVKGAWVSISDPTYFRLTEGRIVSSSTHTSRYKRRTYYHYSIEYEFTIDGKSYRSDKVTFNTNTSFYQEDAQHYIRKYPVGKIVVVYYDPHDPSFSVLEPEELEVLAVGALLFLIISALVFALSSGYWLIGKAFFHKKSSHPADSDDADSDYYEQQRFRHHRDG
jgi:uncharacterized protein DUF3592